MRDTAPFSVKKQYAVLGTRLTHVHLRHCRPPRAYRPVSATSRSRPFSGTEYCFFSRSFDCQLLFAAFITFTFATGYLDQKNQKNIYYFCHHAHTHNGYLQTRKLALDTAVLSAYPLLGGYILTSRPLLTRQIDASTLFHSVTLMYTLTHPSRYNTLQLQIWL